jgi:hypothetical protein
VAVRRSIGCGRKTAGQFWEFETSFGDAATFEPINNHWRVVVDVVMAIAKVNKMFQRRSTFGGLHVRARGKLT